jgi:putative addiction module killer protein
MRMEVCHYLTPAGVDPVQTWLDGLKDLKARVAILRRLDRLLPGNFGDHKLLGSGIWELRIDVGPGYRVYYGHVGRAAVLLLFGGTKRTQAGDISRAAKYWKDWQRRA